MMAGMRTLGLAAAFAALAGAAAGAPQTNRPDRALVCVDVNGALVAPLCRQGQATRIAPSDDSCTCSRGVRVEAPVCPAGVAGPPDSLAVDRARLEYLRRRPSLLGATWEGRPLCVPPGA
jgi:hypothetical protein